MQSFISGGLRNRTAVKAICATFKRTKSKKSGEPVCVSKNVVTPEEPCSTTAASQGRKDPELDKCLYEANAYNTPPCTTRGIEFSPCVVKPHKEEPLPPPFKVSMWENPLGCICPGTDACYFRHDIHLLQPEKKCYKRTWCEFPPRCKVKKLICKSPKVVVAQLEQRPRGQINKAQTKDQPPIDLTAKCPKVVMPGCKRVRDSLKCVNHAPPSCCKKRCTQYPSLSECCWKRSFPKKTECTCLASLASCSVQEALVRGS